MHTLSDLKKAINARHHAEELVKDIVADICRHPESCNCPHKIGDTIKKSTALNGLSDKLIITEIKIEIHENAPYWIFKGFLQKKTGEISRKAATQSMKME